jgi:hypothetical protein
MKPNDKEINTDPVNTLRCLSSFYLWYYSKKLNILKVIKALKKIKRTKAIKISRQATGVWFKRCCVQFKTLPGTSRHQGVNQCQITLLLEQPGGASPAFNATQSQSAQSCDAEHLLQRVKPSAASMAGVAPALVQKQAGQGAGLPTGFMEIQPVRRAQH